MADEMSSTEVTEELRRIYDSLESIHRTLRGSEQEGSPGLLVRTVRLESAVEGHEDDLYELRQEWKSFRRVVMVWALVALFSGAATGTVISNLVFPMGG